MKFDFSSSSSPGYFTLSVKKKNGVGRNATPYFEINRILKGAVDGKAINVDEPGEVIVR